MKILRIPTGTMGANCYIVYDKENKEGIIIDPGAEANRLYEIIKDKDLNLKYIVLTHGHGDHIGGVLELKKKLNIPILAHEKEEEVLLDPKKNLAPMMGLGDLRIEADKFLNEGDLIEFGNHKGRIIHTPGHTVGGMCIEIDKYVFTGDTIFQGSIGRSDFPGGDQRTLVNSIREKILTLDDEKVLLSGHGDETSVGYEKKYNPFI